MSKIFHILCEQCDGKTVVKIPNGYEEYEVVACPLCGASVDLDDEDMDE